MSGQDVGVRPNEAAKLLGEPESKIYELLYSGDLKNINQCTEPIMISRASMHAYVIKRG